MSRQTYEWAKLEEVEGVTLVRLSDGTLSKPGDCEVIDLETNAPPVDAEGRKLMVFSASETHVEFYDPDLPYAENIPTRHLAGRYSVTALPLDI